MKKTPVPITLITTVYNEKGHILSFLESYRSQTVLADEFIVVDGGSVDGTADAIIAFGNKHPDLNIRVIIDATCSKRYTKGPIAKGRNVAIRGAINPYIAVTDTGCVLHPQWFEKISAPFQSPDTDIVSGWYQGVGETAFQREYAEVYLPSLDSVNPDTFLPSSRSITFRKACWEAIGGYPEETYTAEDTKFDLLLKAAGFRFVFAPDAVVFWRCPENIEEAKKKHYQYGFGDGQYRLHLGEYLKNVAKLVFPVRYFLLDQLSPAKARTKYTVTAWQTFGYLKGLLKGCRAGYRR